MGVQKEALDRWGRALRTTLKAINAQPKPRLGFTSSTMFFVVVVSALLVEVEGYQAAYFAAYPDANEEAMRWATIDLALEFWRRGYTMEDIELAVPNAPVLIAFVRDGTVPEVQV